MSNLFIPATVNIKMLVSPAKLLNERYSIDKLERFSIMTKIMHIVMKQSSLLLVCSQYRWGCNTVLFYPSQGIAEAYKKAHPNGSATVTQFQPRPQLLVREQVTHRPTIYSYADAVYSPVLPAPTPESLRHVICS
jgi:hypothetical protein